MDWARDQHHAFPWSIEGEFLVTGARLRSGVKAALVSGQQLAFEVQRMPMDRKGTFATAGMRVGEFAMCGCGPRTFPTLNLMLHILISS